VGLALARPSGAQLRRTSPQKGPPSSSIGPIASQAASPVSRRFPSAVRCAGDGLRHSVAPIQLHLFRISCHGQTVDTFGLRLSEWRARPESGGLCVHATYWYERQRSVRPWLGRCCLRAAPACHRLASAQIATTSVRPDALQTASLVFLRSFAVGRGLGDGRKSA
jgi:hypothetical protein